MSDSNETHDQHRKIADAFGRTTDPLKEYDERFNSLADVNPFDLFLDDRIYPQDYSQDYVNGIERRLRQWQEFMKNNHDRHPACPSTQHVVEFATYCLETRDNSPGTVSEKLGTLRRCFQYFQEEPSFPHPTDYNPIGAAKSKLDLSEDDPKAPRPISLSELREFLQEEVTHIRDRAIILIGFKLGLRASEVSNIKLSEVHIANSELQTHYDELGTVPPLNDRPNAVYIPHDRERNKRDRPTVLPLDDELRQTLLQYLLVRPDNGEEWLFLSKTNGLKMDHTNINDLWKKHFRPEYGPTRRYRGVSSHYGRHFFTTYFRVEKDWPRELLKYMRGDRQSGGEIRSTRDAIDSYIHTFYEDINQRYRREVFKFRL